MDSFTTSCFGALSGSLCAMVATIAVEDYLAPAAFQTLIYTFFGVNLASVALLLCRDYPSLPSSDTQLSPNIALGRLTVE